MRNAILIAFSLGVLTLTSPVLFAEDPDSDDSSSTAEESTPAPNPAVKDARAPRERIHMDKMDLSPIQEMMMKCHENKKGGKACHEEMMAKCQGEMAKSEGECKMMINRARMFGMGRIKGMKKK